MEVAWWCEDVARGFPSGRKAWDLERLNPNDGFFPNGSVRWYSLSAIGEEWEGASVGRDGVAMGWADRRGKCSAY